MKRLFVGVGNGTTSAVCFIAAAVGDLTLFERVGLIALGWIGLYCALAAARMLHDA